MAWWWLGCDSLAASTFRTASAPAGPSHRHQRGLHQRDVHVPPPILPLVLLRPQLAANKHWTGTFEQSPYWSTSSTNAYVAA